MLEGLFRNNFKTKCKSLLNRIKTRLEVLKKRRNAMQKFLKKDIAELLKSNLDTNAYGRKTGVSQFALLWSHLEWANIASMAEGLYMELNLSACYDFVEQCCNRTLDSLKEMHKQSECPEKCSVAVSSLTYAAARFADLPELRDLRNLFDEKYGKSLEPLVDKEFVERLKFKHPTTQMKLQLMKAIAEDFSITWDPSQLEKQMQSPSLLSQGNNAKLSSENGDISGRKLFRNRSTIIHGKGKKVDDGKQIDEEDARAAKNRRHNSISGLKENMANKTQQKNNFREVKPPQSSSRSTSENVENRKPFANRLVPAPYTITNDNAKDESENQKNEKNDSLAKVNDKPRPRSVRTKFLKSSASTSSTNSTTSNIFSENANDPRESLSARVPQAGIHDILSDDEEQEEEEKADKLLSLFGKKKPPQSYTPTSARKDDNETPKTELPPPPGRRRYLFSENQPESPIKPGSERSRFVPPCQKQYPIRQVKSTPQLNEEAGGHQVHPNMPSFDELAERIAIMNHV